MVIIRNIFGILSSLLFLFIIPTIIVCFVRSVYVRYKTGYWWSFWDFIFRYAIISIIVFVICLIIGA